MSMDKIILGNICALDRQIESIYLKDGIIQYDRLLNNMNVSNIVIFYTNFLNEDIGEISGVKLISTLFDNDIVYKNDYRGRLT